jgi:hypothetical protein
MKYTEIEIEFPPDDGNGQRVRIRINGADAVPGRGNPASHKANNAPHVLNPVPRAQLPATSPTPPKPRTFASIWQGVARRFGIKTP